MTKKVGALITLCWMLLLFLATIFTYASAKPVQSRHHATMIEARLLSETAMQAIKQYKIKNGIEISRDDTLNTGMIGEFYSDITTTTGDLSAKRTSTNPDWASVFVSMFARANLKRGDQVGMIFSGSFPALSISALASAQAYGLKTCVMASIGASSYGANQPDLTILDMSQYLVEQGYLQNGIDYISWGGDNDDGREFFEDFEDTAKAIEQRMKNSSAVFIKESDYSKNISLRVNYFKKDVPKMKFLINIGGSIVGAGMHPLNFTASGYIEPDFSKSSPALPPLLVGGGYGLLDYYHLRALPVANILNIKQLANEYGIIFDPPFIPSESEANVYYEENYNLVFAIVALVVSTALLVCYYIYRKKTGFRM